MIWMIKLPVWWQHYGLFFFFFGRWGQGRRNPFKKLVNIPRENTFVQICDAGIEIFSYDSKKR